MCASWWATYEEITERRFGNWTMGHVNIAKVNASLLLKYSERAAVALGDPFASRGARPWRCSTS
jgi:hypothetical protein